MSASSFHNASETSDYAGIALAQVFRNTRFTRRSSDCTNIVACVAHTAPAAHWARADADLLDGLTYLSRQAGVEYWGHL